MDISITHYFRVKLALTCLSSNVAFDLQKWEQKVSIVNIDNIGNYLGGIIYS